MTDRRTATAEARIAERTPQGGYSVVGVGVPPFALDAVEASPCRSCRQTDTASSATANTPPTIPEINSGSRPSAPHRNPAHNPAASTAKPLAALEHSLRAGLQLRADQR